MRRCRLCRRPEWQDELCLTHIILGVSWNQHKEREEFPADYGEYGDWHWGCD